MNLETISPLDQMLTEAQERVETIAGELRAADSQAEELRLVIQNKRNELIAAQAACSTLLRALGMSALPNTLPPGLFRGPTEIAR